MNELNILSCKSATLEAVFVLRAWLEPKYVNLR